MIVNDNEGAMSFNPDGLTEQMIDVLLREVEAAVAGPRATSALQAGTAAERRQRRMERRAVAVPVHGTATGFRWPGAWGMELSVATPLLHDVVAGRRLLPLRPELLATGRV